MINLDDLRIAAQKKAVSFAVHYCEADDSWYGVISSNAPSENWVGKNRSLPCAMEELLEAIRRL